MTQSGQGNEPHLPAVPPAQPSQPVREGVVLPAQGDQRPPERQHQVAPAGGQAWGQPWGPQSAQPGTAGGGEQLPPEGGSYGQAAPPPPQQEQPYIQQSWASPPHQGQLPPERPAQPFVNAAEETQVLPPQPAGDAEATQYIPPVLGQAPGAAPPPQDTPTTTFAKATSAPLPPETPKPESPAESTTQLRAVRPGRGAHRGRQAEQPQQPQAQPPQPQPLPRSQSQAAANAAEETQVLPGPVPSGPGPAAGPPRPGGAPFAIRPGRPGDRPPPAEFDGLFRADGGAGSEAPDETQQLPQFGQHGPGVPPSGGQPGHGGRRGGGGGRRRRMSPAVLIGIVVAGCGIAGLAAGAALSAGGDDEGEKDKNSTLSSPSPDAADDEPTKAADPARTQAKALDALLADSNNSRASVIRAVNNIKSCKDLTTAASDLRTAAGQRNNLVTRLGKLSVDRLPNHAQLTAALTKAWKSSATADNQYAAWADQVGGKKGCHKGKARRTPRVGAAERASGEATEAKKKASGLWNPIAQKYGLTQHQATQL